jgi:hypothetical protein
MSNKITDLRPAAAQMAAEAGRRLNAAGIPFCDTSTLRTDATQIACHAQGRKQLDEVNRLRRIAGERPITAAENKYTITNCDGVTTKSRHQGGTAIDRVPADAKGNPIWPPADDPRWRQIADIMIAVGFRWGMDWNGDGKTRYDGDQSEKMLDPPHYELWEV